MSQFRFKQFTIEQDRAAMKVGFDGILLGAWTDVRNCRRILDIGTGTGLLALMLAQRTQAGTAGLRAVSNGLEISANQSRSTTPALPAVIDAVEIDPDASLDARRNAENSPWSDRIQIIEDSLQAFARATRERYDLIVSNPPWFASHAAPQTPRETARQNQSLPMHELLAQANRLLLSGGRISLVLPHAAASAVLEIALDHGLYLQRQMSVRPTANKPVHRELLEFRDKQTDIVIKQSLTIERSRHCYTPEFCNLTREFYLKL